MPSNYFSLIPRDGSYIGKLTFPNEIRSRWIEIPSSIEDIDCLNEWLITREDKEPYVVILFSIWAGLDIGTLDWLIQRSNDFTNLNFFYQSHHDSNFRMNFYKQNEFIHSPIVLLGKSDKTLEAFNGRIDRGLLEKEIEKISSNLSN